MLVIIAKAFKFQFHYGSIKGLRGFFLDYQLQCFNSTMVRLKGTSGKQ